MWIYRDYIQKGYSVMGLGTRYAWMVFSSLENPFGKKRPVLSNPYLLYRPLDSSATDKTSLHSGSLGLIFSHQF